MHFKPWSYKEYLLSSLILVLAIFGVTAEKTVRKALRPDRHLCQVPISAFTAAPNPITFHSKADGTLLKGWYLRTQADKSKGVIILAHGYRQNRLPNFPAAINLVNAALSAGYNFLLFDFRNCGESEGTVTTFGLLESQDLLSAVELIKTKLNPENPVYVLGISMGAVAGILAAAQSDQIAGVIADSAFSDLRTYFQNHLEVWTGLPSFPFNQLLLSLGPQLAGFNITEVSPISVASDLQVPILVIHSRTDTQVPVSEGLRLYDAIGSTNKELWLVDKTRHGFAFATHHQEYAQRVLGFLQKQK